MTCVDDSECTEVVAIRGTIQFHISLLSRELFNDSPHPLNFIIQQQQCLRRVRSLKSYFIVLWLPIVVVSVTIEREAWLKLKSI